MINRKDLKFSHELRVRYSEIDAQSIVFNAHYLTYFDCGITELFRKLDLRFSGFDATYLEHDYHVVKSTIEYHSSVYFDEIIQIYVALGRIGTSSLTFRLFIFVGDEDTPRTSGEVIWVYANRKTHKATPLPQGIIDKLMPYLLEQDDEEQLTM